MQKLYKLQLNEIKKDLSLSKAFCIGYTGRDKEKTYEHISELAEIGIPEPDEVPMLYPVSMNTVTQDNNMEVLGRETSGEAEIVLIFGDTEDEIYLTVGSDHTDRDLETIDINKSKQACSKPFANKVWKLNDVLGHWDELELSSDVYLDGKWIPYQKNTLEAILPYDEIIDFINKTGAPKNNSIFFSGTVPLLDGFKYGSKFRMSFTDPVTNDVISAEYNIENIERK